MRIWCKTVIHTTVGRITTISTKFTVCIARATFIVLSNCAAPGYAIAPRRHDTGTANTVSAAPITSRTSKQSTSVVSTATRMRSGRRAISRYVPLIVGQICRCG